ncbi:leukocyte-associated immunoglobulin-like receptor 1 [Urocitellus parryii]
MWQDALMAHLGVGTLPRPSISAEPGSEIPRGRPVTIVCQAPAGFEYFRLEKEGSSQIWDEKNSSPSEREARFLFPSMTAPALLLTTEHLYLLIGVPLALLLCLLLLLLFCLHRQHQRKPGPPGGQGQLQRPQERLGLAVDSLERSPDMATADRPPEKDRETGNPAPAARDPQEVTYAELDHGALTERAARAGSPLTPEPSTYATLARH